MIPKVIHYCWFGHGEKSQEMLRYLETWKQCMPSYKIKEWNEDNFNINQYQYTKEAYATGSYAFVSDVARLFVLYNYGGIYLDTDVEVLKSFDSLLSNKSFLGFEADSQIGSGIIGAESHTPWIYELLSQYQSENFISWLGKLRKAPNTFRFTTYFNNQQLKFNNEEQLLANGTRVYPIEYLCAKNFRTRESYVNNHTYSIHHYTISWVDSKPKKPIELVYKRLIHLLLKLKVYLIPLR